MDEFNIDDLLMKNKSDVMQEPSIDELFPPVAAPEKPIVPVAPKKRVIATAPVQSNESPSQQSAPSVETSQEPAFNVDDLIEKQKKFKENQELRSMISGAADRFARVGTVGQYMKNRAPGDAGMQKSMDEFNKQQETPMDSYKQKVDTEKLAMAMRQAKDAADPNSQFSKNRQMEFDATLAYGDEVFKDQPKMLEAVRALRGRIGTMSANDIDKAQAFEKLISSRMDAKIKLESIRAQHEQTAALRGNMQDIRLQNQAKGVAEDFNKPVFQRLVTFRQGLDNSERALNDESIPLLPQRVNTIIMDQSNALSATPGGATVQRISMEEIPRIQSRLAEWQQKLGRDFEKADLRKLDPELYRLLDKQNDELKEQMDTHLSNQMERMRKSYSGFNNPYIDKVIKNNAQSYMRPEAYKKSFGEDLPEDARIPSYKEQKKMMQKASGKSYGNDVLEYAKKYGIDPEQAQSIKDKRGG